jgi:hypothetical protein
MVVVIIIISLFADFKAVLGYGPEKPAFRILYVSCDLKVNRSSELVALIVRVFFMLHAGHSYTAGY